MSLAPGTSVGRYRIVGALGAGGMGVVYEAEDTRLGRRVALKFLPADPACDQHALERFRREARAASALNHPHICTVYDIDAADGQPFIAMELLEGRTLRAALGTRPSALGKATPGLPIDELLPIALQLADALEAAHAKDILHRDIKPANIFLTTRGAAKLLDFGIAKLAADPRPADTEAETAGGWATGAGVTFGTVGYMSPEQVRGEALDARTDLFSLGVVLYEMATGTAPFRGATSGAVLAEVLTKTPPAPVRVNPEVPPDLERIVTKLLEKDRALRYLSVSELRTDLERLNQKLVGRARDQSHPRQVEQPSIVVLPFENLSADPDNAYFADGLTEELIADLSKVRELRVISRTSAMKFRGTGQALPEIARTLNVRHVVEGSVRKAGNNLRITAQLIDAATDAHLWAENYCGTLDDVFDVQEKVSRAIVAALQLALAPDEDRRLAERPLSSGPAYDAYLRARQEIARWSLPALDRARQQLEQALALFGEQPVLLAGLGSVYSILYFGAFQMDEETLQKAEDYGTRGVGMEPALAEGHFVLGMVALARGRLLTAFNALRRALSLNPSDPDAAGWLSEITCCYVGRPEIGGPLAARLLLTDPLSANSYVSVALHHIYEGRFDDALEPARTAFRLDPESNRVRFAYFLCSMYALRAAEVVPMLERWRREAPEHIWLELFTAVLAAQRGEEVPLSDRALEVVWMDFSAAGHGVPMMYAMLGKTDEAMKWLTRGVDLGFINYPFLSRHEPYLASVRGDPRFEALMVRVRREWEAFERSAAQSSSQLAPSAPASVPRRPRRPIVGRQAERAALLTAFETVAAGRGCVVGIAGEAGIGKTTLAEEFVADLDARGAACTIARGRCSERLAGTEAYLPWLEALESLVRGEGGPAWASTLRTVAPTWYAQVMPLAPDDSAAARLLVDVKTASQERLKRELAALLEELGRQRPLVLFFDDLHWADASTVDLLAYVAGRFDQVRALVVATYRPAELARAAHSFGALKLDLATRGVARELALGFLDRDDVAQYVGLTFPGHRFPPAFVHLVHAKTEGNPLFVTDLLRELRDRGTLAEQDSGWAVTRDLPAVERELPTSVRSLIERKIPQVGDADRRLLQAASVQGCDFDSAVVARALGMDAADVEERLEVLERVHALIIRVEETTPPDGTPNLRGRFVHVLYQHALYESLAPSRRVSLSSAVAQALVAVHREQESTVAAQVAFLFEAARDFQQAGEFFDIAARHAAGRAANREAVVLAERGLVVVGRLAGSSECKRQELELNVTLGHTLFRVEGFLAPAAIRALERARVLSRETGATSTELSAALGGLLASYHSRGDLSKALSIGGEMLDGARRLSDESLEAVAVGASGTVLFHMGRVAEARTSLERSAVTLKPGAPGNPSENFTDWRVVVLSVLTCTLGVLGYPDRGAMRSAETLDLARQLGQPYAETFALVWATYLGHLRREWAETIALANRMADLCARDHFPDFGLLARGVLARCLVEQGDPVAAASQFGRYLDDYRRSGFDLNLVMFRGWLAAAHAAAGQIDAGLRVVDEALADASRRDERWYEAEIHRLKGDLLLKSDPTSEADAERSFLEAIGVARGQEARWWELRASVSLGRLWKRQGRREEARRLVAGIYDWFTEGFDTVDLREARALLDELA